MAVLVDISVDVAFPITDAFEVVTVAVTSDLLPESGPGKSSFDGDNSSEVGEFRGFVSVGDVYLLDDGVKWVILGAEIPLTARVGFDSCNKQNE